MSQNSIVIFKEVLQKIISNPVNSNQVADNETPGNKLKKVCEMLLTKNLEEGEELINVAVNVFELVRDLNPADEKDQRILWGRIQHFKVEEDNMKNIISLFKKHDINHDSFNSMFLFDSFLTEIIAYILKYENAHKIEKEVQIQKEPLTNNEQQILRYVSGFIIFSLRNKYKLLLKSSKSKEVANAVLQLLNTFGNPEMKKINSYLDFTHQWVELNNRGGLIQVNDDFYLFIRTIENLVRNTLNLNLIRKYKGEDLGDAMKYG